jgi:hypothetical protein
LLLVFASSPLLGRLQLDGFPTYHQSALAAKKIVFCDVFQVRAALPNFLTPQANKMLNAVVENTICLPRAGRFSAGAKVGFWEVTAISISTGACVTIIATEVAAEATVTHGIHFIPWDEHLC